MDTELVLKAHRGEAGALESLIGAVAPRLRSVARSIVRDADLADEAAQQVLIAIWRNLSGLRDADAFDAWSHRLLVNACHAGFREGRRLAPARPDFEIQPALAEDLADGLGMLADRDRLERAMLRLPTHQRAVVALHHQHDLTLEAVAMILGVPVGTVWSRLHRAMDGLRSALEAESRGDGLTVGAPGAARWEPRRAVRPWASGLRPPPATADGRVIVVAQDGTGDETTIGAAVRVARAGDMVLVRPGSYRESIVVTRDIAIVGDGDKGEIIVDFRDGTAQTIVEGVHGLSSYDGVASSFGVRLDDTRASILNLSLRGPRDGVALVVRGGAPTIGHVTATLDGVWRGPPWMHHFLFMSGGADGSVTDCQSRGHVHIEQASSPTVEHNEFSGALVVGSRGSKPLIRDNAIIVQTRTRWAVGAGWGSTPIIEHNDISWPDGAAVTLADGSPAVVRDNVIRSSRTGISINGGDTATISDNDVEARTTGILVDGSDPVLTGNLMRGASPGGIVLVRGSHATLDRNAMESHADRPVLARVDGVVR